MAEFPNLGEHCGHSECRQLDFLPIKCYGCSKMYCSKHYMYEAHNCTSGLVSNVKVPVCPLCNQPVPVGKTESADFVVGQHIDNDCQSDPARKKRAYVNVCSVKGCKKRELVPIKCVKCKRNFCIKHRYFDDHECTGSDSNPRLKPASKLDAHERLKADEEYARALQQRLTTRGCTSEELDRRLAEQLQREEYNDPVRVGGESSSQKHNPCCIS